jgi:hypothetical protein
MAFSLFPSYIVIEYSSAFGVHTMTIPIRQWEASAGDLGSADSWVGGARDLDDMVEDLVNALAELFPATTTFETATVYNYPDIDSDPDPVGQHALGIVGTSVSTAWSKAVQQTFTFRTNDFNIYKLVLLDVPTDNNFNRVPAAAFTADFDAVVDQLTGDVNAWQGRDGSQIVQPIQASATLNEKLRRSYRMF